MIDYSKGVEQPKKLSKSDKKKLEMMRQRGQHILEYGPSEGDMESYNSLGHLWPFWEYLEEWQYRNKEHAEREDERYDKLYAQGCQEMSDYFRHMILKYSLDYAVCYVDMQTHKVIRELARDEINAKMIDDVYHDKAKCLVGHKMKDPQMMDMLRSDMPGWVRHRDLLPDGSWSGSDWECWVIKSHWNQDEKNLRIYKAASKRAYFAQLAEKQDREDEKHNPDRFLGAYE